MSGPINLELKYVNSIWQTYGMEGNGKTVGSQVDASRVSVFCLCQCSKATCANLHKV